MDADKSSEARIVEVLGKLCLRPDFPKSIVDVGANINASISVPFIDAGWDCLLIEPQEHCVHVLGEKFAGFGNVEIMNCGCSDVASEAVLYHGKDGVGSELATLNTRSDPWMSSVRSDTSSETIQLRTLDEILLSRSDRFCDIGILKVDTESWDYHVLKGLDFSRCKPKVIVTEEYLWDIDLTVGKHRLLERFGYVNVGWIEYNTIWCDSEYYDFTWSDLALYPWLSQVRKTAFPVDIAEHFVGIRDVVSKRSARDKLLGWIDVVVNAPKSISGRKGKIFDVPLVVLNLSRRPILPVEDGFQLFVSYHWEQGGNVVEWDGMRTPLSHVIEPNTSVFESIRVLAPESAGSYILLVDFVVENVGWLSEDRGIICVLDVCVD
jgi:FkbM family methyltransferase